MYQYFFRTLSRQIYFIKHKKSLPIYLAIMRMHRLKYFLEEDRHTYILPWQYYSFWWPGDTCSLGINSYDIDLFIKKMRVAHPERLDKYTFSWKMLKGVAKWCINIFFRTLSRQIYFIKHKKSLPIYLAIMRMHRLKYFLEEDRHTYILPWQYYSFWWPGDTCSLGINSYDIDLFIKKMRVAHPEWLDF